jgi:hypothetical protein
MILLACVHVYKHFVAIVSCFIRDVGIFVNACISSCDQWPTSAVVPRLEVILYTPVCASLLVSTNVLRVD